jgi:hypothetical protein
MNDVQDSPGNMPDKNWPQAGRLKQIRLIVPTVLAIMLMLMCFFLLASIGAANETAALSIATPLPTITPTSKPNLITVEYQLEVSSTVMLVPVQFWFTSDNEGQNLAQSRQMSNGRPFTATIQANPGAFVELAGVITNGREGTLTCRILVEGTVVAQKVGQGRGAATYCSGTVDGRK